MVSRTGTEYQERFFTSASNMWKDKFMAQINYSPGALTCSFNDHQLTEYIQSQRRTAGRLPVKHEVECVSSQGDGSWVLVPSLFFNCMSAFGAEGIHAWLGHIYDGPGIANQSSACQISLPLSIDPLKSLYLWAKSNRSHNFIPCMMLAGACSMALHYRQILSKFLFCPVPVVYGKKFPSHLVSKATYWFSEKHWQLK